MTQPAQPTQSDQPAQPGLGARLWYAVGGRMPRRHADYVLRTATDRTWLARFALRVLLRAVLPATVLITLVLLLALDAPIGLALACGALGLIVGMYYALSYSIESVEGLVARYGFAPGTAARLREERKEARDPEREARYAARWRDAGGA
ncbi:DUF5313 family protein [Actinokineospora bangkokensis]|uniref:DUF5313 domain-containing protein n=1 Tax=Actinokineospora bangkokensis TaxID=1193682 RepID=A0A1Q9LPQ2_9PSEU|nr:DUF5313 family protein [Actinokineospora bangkokensis]OLR93999.1 hypothetical protein BJP25_13560 [Actinokineospora bangkokensis]